MEEQLLTNIFYADDDLDDLDFFREVTTEINESASLFDEGGEMLDSLFNPPPKPSVIFLDLNMPVKSGFEVLNEIKARPNLVDVPVIILTTSNNPSDISKCKEMGANLYIQKPASMAALKKAINYVMETDWNNSADKEFLYRHL